MTNTIITEGQSLVDVAIQELGTVASLFDLADTNGMAITDMLEAGQTLEVPMPDATAVAIAGYFSKRSQRINTGDELVPAIATTQHYFSFQFFRTDYYA